MRKLRALLRNGRVFIDTGRHLVGWHQSEAALTRDAQRFWDAPPERIRDAFAHWRSGFDDATTWLAIGRENLNVFETFARSAQFTSPVRRMVEWGCGGGANAVHFGRVAEEFFGVDITQATLDECGRQMAEAGLANFKPVLIDAASPEKALETVPRGCDLFVSFYVFEVFPTPEYGARVLRIAHDLLRPGGMAVIHFKYPVGLATRSRRWGYRFGAANMTTYRVDEFWQLAESCGFKPHAVSLMPKQPLVGDERYAYAVLTKP